MAVTPKVLFHGVNAGTATTTNYVATNCKTIIDKYTAANYGGSTVTLSVYMVQSGSAAASSNIVSVTKSLAIAETYTFPEVVGQMLEAGGGLVSVASAQTSISIRAAGREVT